jgi:hypothetical protein
VIPAEVARRGKPELSVASITVRIEAREERELKLTNVVAILSLTMKMKSRQFPPSSAKEAMTNQKLRLKGLMESLRMPLYLRWKKVRIISVAVLSLPLKDLPALPALTIKKHWKKLKR